MKCPRGWILCQNEEGYTVPYFVKVRATDVLTSNSISDKFGLAGILPANLDVSNILILPAGQTYFLGLNGWRLWLNNNETFKAQKSITIDDTTATVVDNSIVKIKVTPPFKIEGDEILDIRVRKELNNKSLIQSYVNTELTKSIVGEPIVSTLESITIDLYTTSTLPNDFLSSLHDAGKIIVTIEGMAKLGKYAHMDEYGQIGAPWDPSASSSVITPSNVYSKNEINALMNQMRQDIQNGDLIGPRDIVDVVDNVTDSVVLPKGIVFDVETAEEIAAQQRVKEAQKSVAIHQTEGDELQKKEEDESIISMDISNLNFGNSDES